MSRCRFCEEMIQPGNKFCPQCGADVPEEDFQPSPLELDDSLKRTLENIDDPFEKMIAATFTSSGKISAIKLYREKKGVGLKDAKDAVEALAHKHGIKSTGTGCAEMLLLCLIFCSVCIGFSVMSG
jgi:hypothetical protein